MDCPQYLIHKYSIKGLFSGLEASPGFLWRCFLILCFICIHELTLNWDGFLPLKYKMPRACGYPKSGESCLFTIGKGSNHCKFTVSKNNFLILIYSFSNGTLFWNILSICHKSPNELFGAPFKIMYPPSQADLGFKSWFSHIL